mgnify:CR=1 FL=1
MKDIDKAIEDCKRSIEAEKNDCFRNSFKILLKVLEDNKDEDIIN